MSTIAQGRAELGYALNENEGEAFWLLGMLQTIKIGAQDTGGTYGLVEIVVPAGLGSPWHVHPEEDEWFYVLEGELTVWVADTRLSLNAGSFAFGPKGVPHTFYAETIIDLAADLDRLEHPEQPERLALVLAQRIPVRCTLCSNCGHLP